MLLQGNCLETLKTLDTGSVDSIVTDPPYELGFMGKSWDASGIAYNAELWAECLRVLKPGGHLLAFSGSRTYHRMVVAIEDSGFEVRDQIMWLYGSGFPKSLDISKAIDKQRDDSKESSEVARFLLKYNTFRTVSEFRLLLNNRIIGESHSGGSAQGWTTLRTDKKVKPRVPTWEQWLKIKVLLGFGDEMDSKVWLLNGNKGQPGDAWFEREVVGTKKGTKGVDGTSGHGIIPGGITVPIEVNITAPATPEAQQWQGWGTALKPAHEPIVVARKPLIGTVANNVLTYGTGGLNIDGSRVGTADGFGGGAKASSGFVNGYEADGFVASTQGRWPANIVITHSPDCEQECAEGCPARELDESARYFNQTTYTEPDYPQFLYCAKAGKKERNAGLEGLPERHPSEVTGRKVGSAGAQNGGYAGMSETPRANIHPTVKPLTLMRHLVKLVTPPNGTVLDPFLGSGTTAVAATLEGFQWIGCEMTEDYWPIIEARVEWARAQTKETLF